MQNDEKQILKINLEIMNNFVIEKYEDPNELSAWNYFYKNLSIENNKIANKLLEQYKKHKSIIEFFTKDIQIDKLVEELDELQEAIFENDYEGSKLTETHMYEEMADVFNVLSQFYVTNKKMRKWCNFKLDSTLNYIEDWKKKAKVKS